MEEDALDKEITDVLESTDTETIVPEKKEEKVNYSYELKDGTEVKFTDEMQQHIKDTEDSLKNDFDKLEEEAEDEVDAG